MHSVRCAACQQKMRRDKTGAVREIHEAYAEVASQQVLAPRTVHTLRSHHCRQVWRGLHYGAVDHCEQATGLIATREVRKETPHEGEHYYRSRADVEQRGCSGRSQFDCL